jgi:hypothetical protein
MTREFKVGKLVRIKKFAEGDPSGFGHKLKDVGVIRYAGQNCIGVVVPGRVSTSGGAPGVYYKKSDLQLL